MTLYPLQLQPKPDFLLKAAHFPEPVVLVKQIVEDGEKKGFKRVHTNFQSTLSCNISMVNAIVLCLYAQDKKRYRRKQKILGH
jgi:hypothetical protein